MTETMWQVLDELIKVYFDGGVSLPLWKLQERIGVDLEGCGILGDPAVTKLLEMGLIEELPDLHCRYRLVVKDSL